MRQILHVSSRPAFTWACGDATAAGEAGEGRLHALSFSLSSPTTPACFCASFPSGDFFRPPLPGWLLLQGACGVAAFPVNSPNTPPVFFSGRARAKRTGGSSGEWGRVLSGAGGF